MIRHILPFCPIVNYFGHVIAVGETEELKFSAYLKLQCAKPVQSVAKLSTQLKSKKFVHTILMLNQRECVYILVLGRIRHHHCYLYSGIYIYIMHLFHPKAPYFVSTLKNQLQLVLDNKQNDIENKRHTLFTCINIYIIARLYS